MSRRTRLKVNRRALSPAISTVILTSAVVVLLLVTITFANNFLTSRMAENEFSAVEQFMQTVGLQLDDVAWTIGRTQTIRYASKYGLVNFESVALTYSLEVNGSAGWQPVLNSTTGIILFNMPVDKYTVGNNYFKRIFPSSTGSFLQQGPSAPVSHVFVIEKLPMRDGNYTRIVVAPSLRMLNSTITGTEQKNYFKLYLPCLVRGSQPRASQSITVVGTDVARVVRSGVNAVRVSVTFPNEVLGYDSQFFNFENTVETFNVPNNSIVELYVGEVKVSLGLHA
ncbi:MAG: hypothetical protein ACUVUE_00710 [Candidatus Bathycorpusculaceae bacterium]